MYGKQGVPESVFVGIDGKKVGIWSAPISLDYNSSPSDSNNPMGMRLRFITLVEIAGHCPLYSIATDGNLHGIHVDVAHYSP